MNAPAGGRSGVALALAVLEEVARSGPSLSANGIARAIGMPRASAYRLINSLVSDEYLLRHPTLDGFVLGVRVVELAHLVAPRRHPTVPDPIARLRADTGEAVHLVRYQRGRVVVIDEDPTMPLRSIERTRRQLASSAIGRLLLSGFAPPLSAHADRVALTEVISTAAASGITAHEHRRIADDVAERGFALHTDDDERACFAVAVRSPEGALVGAVAVSTIPTRIDAALMHLDRVRETSTLLFRPPDEANGFTAAG